MNMEAKSGQGMERHLFGLQRIAEENNIDASEFFEDPSWKRSNHIHLRTANVSVTRYHFKHFDSFKNLT